METLPKHPILEFHPNILEMVRKQYDLDKPGMMDKAIDILEEWVQKQDHFLKKDFDRPYLERTIIATKGSIERAKGKLDRMCTLTSLIPSYYEYDDIKNHFADTFKTLQIFPLPKLTKDFYRVCTFKLISNKEFDACPFWEFAKFMGVYCCYMKANDYATGYVFVGDYRELNIMDFVAKINPLEVKQFITFITEGFGMRIKGIHLVTPSKVIDVLVKIFKSVMSAKLGDRIVVHKNMETVYDYVEREILPKEYGGNERSLEEIRDEWNQLISSEETLAYIKEMRKAGVIESYRQAHKLDDCLGLPGTFRTLYVD